MTLTLSFYQYIIDQMPLDAFEARLAFTDLLRRLNASVQSATKCAQFAIRYKDLSEDLYSCIVEELELV